MRKRALIVAMVAVFGLTAFAPAPFPKPNRKDDVKGLAGTWTVTRYERGGTAVARAAGSALKVRIEGNKWSFLRVNATGRMPTVSYTITLDPKKAPRCIDLTKAAPLAGAISNTLLGIYRFEGNDRNKVQVVFNTFGVTTRPASFDGADRQAYVMVLQRDKP
jgi:uncharacterized protein (TIGR03067 family)